ncbi:alpha-amylase family glycosyl hydrolase [soil metagenome]
MSERSQNIVSREPARLHGAGDSGAVVEPDAQKWERVRARLASLYGNEAAAEVVPELRKLVARRSPLGFAAAESPWSERDVLLITYADSVIDSRADGGRAPMEALGQFLEEHVGGDITFLHLLPFFPSTSDDGFSVVDHRMVRPDLGSWRDVEALSKHFRVVFDAVLNHVSASSHYVEGYLAGEPEFAGFCVEVDPETDLSRVVRPRNLPLLHEYPAADGRGRWLWTTFSRDQVDLNFANPRVLLEILDVLLFYAERGASMLRLDAIPYLWKSVGTGCVHLRQTHTIIALIRDVFDLAAPHVLLLSETNVPHNENISYFGNGGDEAQVIYNFSLAPLTLFSLTAGDATKLTRWAQELGPYWRGCTYLNITATHDGIGMRPTEGILTEAERQRLVDLARVHGGDVSYKRNPDGTLTPYELNITYFDAINDPSAGTPVEVEVARFLVSQAISMVLKGIPGLYVHSLLGSRNDPAGVGRTKRARSINRQRLELAVLEAALADPGSRRARVLIGLRRLMRARRQHPAFHPDSDQQVLDLGPKVFAVLRREHHTGARVLALHNVTSKRVRIDRHKIPVHGPLTDLVTGQLIWLGGPGEDIVLMPFQVAWLA